MTTNTAEETQARTHRSPFIHSKEQFQELSAYWKQKCTKGRVSGEDHLVYDILMGRDPAASAFRSVKQFAFEVVWTPSVVSAFPYVSLADAAEIHRIGEKFIVNAMVAHYAKLAKRDVEAAAARANI